MKHDGSAFDWNQMRAFLTTAEEGSFSAAARALGSSQPTLGRQVSALEMQLGIALFERIGPKLIVTPSGLALLESARAMRDAAAQASMTAIGQSQAIEGVIRISVGEIFAGHALPPIIAKLRQSEPGVEIEIVASNSSSDLRLREADIAFRATRPKEPELIATKVGVLTSGFYAAPDYLERLGPIRTKDDFQRLDFIDFDDGGAYRAYLMDLGFSLTARNFPVRAESHLLQWELAKAGLGVVTALDLIGDADPSVKRVLPDDVVTQSMWLVAHRELKTSRRIRMAFDFFLSEFRALLRRA